MSWYLRLYGEYFKLIETTPLPPQMLDVRGRPTCWWRDDAGEPVFWPKPSSPRYEPVELEPPPP